MENSTKVVTGKVRFCYTNVFEPQAMNEGDTDQIRSSYELNTEVQHLYSYTKNRYCNY